MGYDDETTYRRKKVYNTGGFDDTISREYTIPFATQVLSLNVKSNPARKKIDLIGVDDPTIGIEIEHSKKWVGDYWDKRNHGLNTISNVGYMTVNLPWWRKYNFWTEGLDPNWDKNLFIRWNSDFTCAIVVSPQTILDRRKSIDANFRTYDITTGDVESWKIFRREHVDTYNLINDIWVLSKISK